MTTFQERVWQLIGQVPAGKVTTYKAVAQALGSRAYRAVGLALHRNPHAPVVPCHRVIASDLSLGGFAYGVAQKRALLLAEGVKMAGDKVLPEYCLWELTPIGEYTRED